MRKACRADQGGSSAAVPFAVRLERRFAAEPPRRKSLRTRERLLIGAAVALEQKGFHDLRVADIAAAADLSPAAFYCYFRDKADAALAVLQRFAGVLFDTGPLAAGPSAAAELTGAFERVFSAVRANPGLVRASDELRDDAPSWSAWVDLCAQGWHRRLTQDVLRRHPDRSGTPLSAALGRADLLAAMTDGLARRAARQPAFRADIHELVRIWLRSLYPEPDPARAALASAAREAFPRALDLRHSLSALTAG